MKKFWIGNLAFSLLLIIVYLTVGRTASSGAVPVARGILYVSVVQLFVETIGSIFLIDRQTRLDIVFSISAIFFSVLITLFMWPLVYNAAM